MFITEEKILKKIFQERSRGNIERAKKHALKGYEKFPESFDINVELIQLCMESSDCHEAVKYMKSAVRNNPAKKSDIIQFASEAFYNSSDPFLGSFIIESHIRSMDIDSVRNFLNRVSRKYLKGLIKRSETKSAGFIQRSDTGSSTFTDNELLLGLLYAEDGRFEDAVRPLGNALENYPEQAEKIGSVMLEFQREASDNAELEYQLGMASIYLKHPGKAEHRFFSALRMQDPPLERILEVIEEEGSGENRDLLRGEILLRLGKESEGIEGIRDYLSAEEDGWNQNPEGRIKQLFPAHIDRKTNCYDRLLLLPEDVLYRQDTLFLLCDICSDLNKYRDVSEHLEKLAELSPESSGEIIKWIESRENILQTAPAQKILASLYLKNAEYGRSRSYFNAAAEMDPETAPELIKLVNERVEQHGRDPFLLKILVDLYTKTGESERAQSLLQELKDEETLSGEEAVEMASKVLEKCGATIENIVSAIEFSSENNSTSNFVSHFAEFCRANPDRHDKLASEIRKLASASERLYPFIAGVIAEAGKECKLGDPLKYLQAIAYLNSGQIEKAVFAFDQLMMFNEDIRYDVIEEYEKVLPENMDNSTLLLAMYQMNIDDESYLRAAHYLGKFLESDRSRIKDVISRFDQLVEKMPSEPGIWKEMLESALSINHGSLAHQILERAVNTLGEIEAAPLHVYGAALYRENGNTGEALKCLAIALTSEKSDLKSVEKELDSIMRMHPENAGALYLYGETSLRLGKEEKSVEHFRKCIEASPEYTGRVREKLSEALPASVKPWIINRLLGVISWNNGKRNEAIAFFSRARKGDPDSLSILASELENCLNDDSGNIELKQLYADVLRLLKDYPGAAAQIEELLESEEYSPDKGAAFLRLITGEDANQFEANRLLADILIDSGRIEESVEPAVRMLSSESAETYEMEKSAEKLLSIHGGNGNFVRRYGSIKLLAGKEDEGMELLRKGLEIDPEQHSDILEVISGYEWPSELQREGRLLEADCLIESNDYEKCYRILSGIPEGSGNRPRDILGRVELLIAKQPQEKFFSLALKLEAALHDFRGASERIEKAASSLDSDTLASLKIELAGFADIEGAHSEASDIYSQLLDESSDRNGILKHIESSLAGMAEKRLEEAEARGEINPGEVSELIETALDFGEYSRAREILEMASLAEGKRMYNLGRIYLAMDKPTVAVSLLSGCLSRSSLSPEERAGALYSLGRASEAVFDFGRAATAYMKILEIRGEYLDASTRARINYTRCLEDEAGKFRIEKIAEINQTA